MSEVARRRAHRARARAREARIRNPKRKWYSSRRWRQKRDRQLYKQPWCAMCALRGVSTWATVADHVIPHRWDPDLFWKGKLQSLCKHCHDSMKQRDEIRGFSLAPDEDGWPSDPAHPFNANRTGAGAEPRSKR